MMRLFWLLFLLYLSSGLNSDDPGTHGDLTPQYRKYLQEFGKEEHRVLDPARLEQFRRHTDRVSSHHSDSFTIKLNHFSDLLPEELSQMFSTPIQNGHEAVATSTDNSKSPQEPSMIDSWMSGMVLFRFPWNRSSGDDDSTTVALPATLDWASVDNPLGAPVMSTVRNQGSCGACWAFVAVSTSEAALRIALSRPAAHGSTASAASAAEVVAAASVSVAVTDVTSPAQSRRQLRSVLESEAPAPASGASVELSNFSIVHPVQTSASVDEERSDFESIKSDGLPRAMEMSLSLQDTNPGLSSPTLAWIPSLSVQQLVDCDTTFNRGCSGGSPLFAFHYIIDHGLVPWSRYEYEEKVDVCSVLAASRLPVAKYFIKEYGKVSMLDSTALMAALVKGPIALGVCGTDPYFLLYSSGVFDLDTCCIDQNHAITLVGYGHDDATGLDYWLAQNSWGTRWGEGGYVKIKRTEVFGESGICGMLINPMYGTGGYVLDEKGHYIDPTKTPHYPIYLMNWVHWLQDNWRMVMLIASAVLMCLSLLVLLYACYLDRLMYLHSQLRAAQQGYTPIQADAVHASSGPGTSAGSVTRAA